MGRLFLTIAAGSLVVIGGAWILGVKVPDETRNPPHSKLQAKDPGPLLFKKTDAKPIVVSATRSGREIVISDCFLNPLDKVDISSQKEGQLLFIGYEVPMPRWHWFPEIMADYYKNEFGLGIATFSQGDHEAYVPYQRLYDGDPVEDGQMLALINPDLAQSDIELKRAKILAVEAESRASEYLAREARERLARLERMLGTKAFSVEEYTSAQLTSEK